VDPVGSRRVITCDLAVAVVEPSTIIIQIMTARSAGRVLNERFDVATDGVPERGLQELTDPSETRVVTVLARSGLLSVSYRAEIQARQPRTAGVLGLAPSPVAGTPSSDYLLQLYLRPSRYCPSDHIVGFAVAEFGVGSDVGARVAAITEWIRLRVGYVPGSSSVHDSAEDTLLTGVGTCRDFAHLGVALCRATGVPARFAAVYAPGLLPMDFHAVYEAFVDGRWCVYDATGLAPRSSLVRVVTGRDAADAAFVSVSRGIADLASLVVSATVEADLPIDDGSRIVELAQTSAPGRDRATRVPVAKEPFSSLVNGLCSL
jgi:transglutaminase-like putative cysteine protease